MFLVNSLVAEQIQFLLRIIIGQNPAGRAIRTRSL